MNKINTKRIVTVGLLCAVAYIVMALSHIIPIAPTPLSFLKYDAKDVIIAIGGFIIDPLAAVVISVIVSLVEMIGGISTTGIIGMVMNVLSSVAFAGTASLIYKKRRTIKGAMLGLVSAIFVTCAVMLLWNYFITPLYTGQSVAAVLIPYILPFNIFKATVNAAFTLALYKPVVSALRLAKLVPGSEHKTTAKESFIAVGIALTMIGLAALLIVKVNGRI